MAYSKTNWVNNTTPINETNLNKIESGIKNNDINIGEESYDNTKTYEVGDIVRYNEKIYKCITAITTAENFDSSKWEQTNIVEIVQSEKSKIYELIEALSTPIVGEGENITLNDTAEKRFENFDIEGNSEQEATPSPDYPSEVESCGDNGSINEVICNKNLFPLLKSQSKENKGITFSYNANTQEFNVKGTTTDTSFYTTLTFEELKYLSKDKKYILSISNLMPTKCMVALTKINVISNGIIDEGKKQTTVDNLDKYKPDGFMFYGQNMEVGTKVDFTFKAQVEEGTIATDYVQHEEQSYIIPTQQPMRAIGDIRDTFIKKNNKWYERHYISRLILDGTENFNLGTNANSLIYFLTNAGSIKAKSQDLLCNKLTTVTNLWNETENKNLIAIRSALDLFNIMLSDTTINTVEKFKSWLSEQYNAGTPVYVDYILETPTDRECTEEQSTILFDIEQNAKTYKGVTHIYSNDAVSPNCYVEAAKDLTTLIQ